MVDVSELHDLDDGDLLSRRDDLKEEQFNLRFQNATGQLDNYRRLKEVKRDIARANTVIRSREIAAFEALSEESTDE